MPSQHPPVPLDRLKERRRRVAERLGEGLLVLPAAPIRYASRDTEYPYRPDSELFWLTGLTEPGTVAVLRGGDHPALEVFARARDPEAELWSGVRLGPEGAGELSGADAVHPLSELESRLQTLLDGVRSVHFRPGAHREVEPLVVAGFRRARARGARKGTGPRVLVDPGEILDDLRMVKDDFELDRMREAARITVQGFRALQSRLRPGVPEYALQAALEDAFRSAGGDGPAYGTIVGAGGNACVLHYVDNRAVAADGEMVLVDAGASFGWYAADITRTYPVSGRFTAEQRDLYSVVDRARLAAVETVGPGVSVADVHQAAVAVLCRGLVDLGVLRGDPAELAAEEACKPFFPHRTSHWLGLDVHDVGEYVRDGEGRVLAPGMVLTVEPGLYFGPSAMEAGEGAAEAFTGMGIRLEDDVLVTAEGRENLTSELGASADAVETELAARG